MSFNQTGKSAKRKSIIVLFSLVLILVFAVGGTIAYIVTNTENVENTFTPGQVACEVEEPQFTGSVKENVAIRNTGNTEAYIRAAIVVTWKDCENGNVFGKMPDSDDYELEIGGDWLKSSDGYYYCKSVVAVGEQTPVLIASCQPKENAKNPGGNYALSVEILADAIQSTPDNAVEESWKAVHVVDVEGVKQLEAVSASDN